jgi:RND superfamily putative drug exporter
MLPAVLELLGSFTWRLPRWLDERLPHINIEGSAARELLEPIPPPAPEAEPTAV